MVIKKHASVASGCVVLNYNKGDYGILMKIILVFLLWNTKLFSLKILDPKLSKFYQLL